jgi:hypothetical protein
VARSQRPIPRSLARLGTFALGLLLLAYVGPVAQVSAQASDAEQVLESFERALNAHDEEAVAGLFTADGMVRNNARPGEVITLAQMRAWVRRAAEDNVHAHLGDYTSSGGKTQFTMEVGHGEWYRTGETPLRVQGTAELRGGRIVALVLEPVAQSPSGTPSGIRVFAIATTGPQLLVALAAGGLVTLVAAMALLHRRPRLLDAPPRPTTGTLHSALEAWSTARRAR